MACFTSIVRPCEKKARRISRCKPSYSEVRPSVCAMASTVLKMVARAARRPCLLGMSSSTTFLSVSASSSDDRDDGDDDLAPPACKRALARLNGYVMLLAVALEIAERRNVRDGGGWARR